MLCHPEKECHFELGKYVLETQNNRGSVGLELASCMKAVSLFSPAHVLRSRPAFRWPVTKPQFQ